MKTNLNLLCVYLRTSLFVLMISGISAAPGNAQSGLDGFSYQAVARDASGEVLQNQNIGVKVSVLSSSPGGTLEYDETHDVTTNEFGLFTLMVGDGTPVTGTFAGIDFSTADHYLKVEADFSGGTTYEDLGTTQLLSVPYAQYAKSGIWKKDGSILSNTTGTRAFVNREGTITTTEYFGVRAPVGSGAYGGMYMETSNANGRPFYGYATNGDAKAWTYFNPADSSLRLHNSGLKLTLKASGLTGLKTANPEADFHVIQSATPFPNPTTGGIILEKSGGSQWQIWHSNPYLSFAYNGTRVAYVNSGTGAWTTTSDRSFKKEITAMPPVLTKVRQLKPVEYYYNHQSAEGPKAKGFIAQEVEKVFPELVYSDDADDPSAPLALSYSDFAVLAIKAIQEQQKLIEDQQVELTKLKEEMEAIRQMVQAVK